MRRRVIAFSRRDDPDDLLGELGVYDQREHLRPRALVELGQRLPDLFARFLYVGVTRAATYLAVTSDGDLPAALEPLRSHVSAGTWGA